MKKYLLSFSLVCVGFFVKAQNLVPNPSFEDTIYCPGGGAILGAKYWHAVENTPDYFHECCVFWQQSVPQNYFSYQLPSTGMAYMGLWNYSTIGNYREAIGAYLTTPLAIGEKYFVTYKVCLALNPNAGSNIATDKIGMLFSTDDYLTSLPPRNNYCQVYSQGIVSDSTNWTLVKGSFEADSAYQFITLSNFFTTNITDTMLFYSNNYYQAYYYIDDVCVSTDSIYCDGWSSIPKSVLIGNEILIFPNPAWNEITIDNIPYGCKEIQIFNTDGKLVQTILPVSGFNATLDISPFSEGIYSIVFRLKNSIQIKKFIKSS